MKITINRKEVGNYLSTPNLVSVVTTLTGLEMLRSIGLSRRSRRDVSPMEDD